MSTRLFVYGSLRRGQRYHHWMHQAQWQQLARTLPMYTLLDLGLYPAMCHGGTHAVTGEIYEVDDALLRQLDRFEGHPVHYLRTQIDLADGTEAFAYLWNQANPPNAPIVESGDWALRKGPISGASGVDGCGD